MQAAQQARTAISRQICSFARYKQATSNSQAAHPIMLSCLHPRCNLLALMLCLCIVPQLALLHCVKVWLASAHVATVAGHAVSKLLDTLAAGSIGGGLQKSMGTSDI